MKINRKPNVLKGQHTLAQSKRRRSVALGWKTITKIVRARMFIKEKFSFRTKWITSIFREMMPFNSVRDKFFAIFILFSRTVSAAIPLTGALPRAIAILPFQGEKYLVQTTCVLNETEETTHTK